VAEVPFTRGRRTGEQKDRRRKGVYGISHYLSASKSASSSLYPFQVHYGMIASGDEDIVTIERAAELHTQTGAVAMAWEGAGVARACLFSQIPYLEIQSCLHYQGLAPSSKVACRSGFDGRWSILTSCCPTMWYNVRKPSKLS
jgi:hypothetical protein